MSLSAVLLSTVGFAVRSSSLLPSRVPLPQPVAQRAAGVQMSTRGIVITGGAGGVGYAYADSFMARGHWVVICDVKDPSEAVAALRAKHKGGLGKVDGCVCDVSDSASVEMLGEFAKEKLGTIHYWINNAGINGGRRPFTTVPTRTIEAVVKVNLIGILLCTKVALDIMQAQKGVESHIFNTVGSGVKGGGTPGYAAYGATKRGLPQLTASLVKELTGGVPGVDVPTPAGKVNVHTLSPGMVFTDLLLNDSTPELRKFPFGVLAAQPEEVAEDLVPKILAVAGTGKAVDFLTTDKVLTKFWQKFVEGKKSEYIDDDGNVIKMPGAQYDTNGVRKLY
jgi:chlorophyll(ide) b reductase